MWIGIGYSLSIVHDFKNQSMCNSLTSPKRDFHRNFKSILRRDHQKISYERRAYESVDEKSLS